MNETVATLPPLSADNIDTLKELEMRIAGIKRFFGGASWLRWGRKPRQIPAGEVHPAPLTPEIDSNHQYMEVAPRQIGIPVVVVAKPVGSPLAPLTPLTIPHKVAPCPAPAATLSHQKTMMREAIAQSAPSTIASRITTWVSHRGTRSVSLHDIQRALPDVPKASVSSRVSELHRSGELVCVGAFLNELGNLVNHYVLKGN